MSHDDDLADKLGRLMSEAHSCNDHGAASVQALTRAAVERQEKLRRTVGMLQESLDQLRLSVKYLVFDLEATRRENQYLRKLLAAGDDAAPE